MSSPLQGITVVDLSRLFPGPYASMVLADLGARVIKVESPSAPDIFRFPPPHLDGANVGFSTVNRNKESLVVEITRPEGAAVVAQLATTQADILITSTRPGWLEAHGLGHAQLSERNPGLISCALRGFPSGSPEGQKGGHDINFLALSGLAHQIRDSHGAPVIPGLQLGDIAGGLNAVVAMLAALIERGVSGRGKELEVAITESCASFTVILEAAGLLGEGSGAFEAGPLSGESPVYRYYRCRDGGWVALGAIERKFQKRVLEVLREASPDGQLLGGENWPEDLFFGWEQSGEVHSVLEALFLGRDRDDWCRLFEDFDACFTPVLEVPEALRHSGRHRRVTSSSGVSVLQPAGSLDRCFPPQGEGRTAAAAGRHTASILRELGYNEQQIANLAERGLITIPS